MTQISNALRQWGSSTRNNDHADLQFQAADVIDDLTLLAWALAGGAARWEPFAGHHLSGELCVGGMRHCTALDNSRVPQLTPHAREILAKMHRSRTGVST